MYAISEKNVINAIRSLCALCNDKEVTLNQIKLYIQIEIKAYNNLPNLYGEKIKSCLNSLVNNKILVINHINNDDYYSLIENSDSFKFKFKLLQMKWSFDDQINELIDELEGSKLSKKSSVTLKTSPLKTKILDDQEGSITNDEIENEKVVFVKSETNPNVTYKCSMTYGTCTCPDFKYRKKMCKHLYSACQITGTQPYLIKLKVNNSKIL